MNNEKYMKIAINLASKGNGNVYTNPLVGCVIVKNNKIVGRGWHEYFGGNHAEVNAIINAGENSNGADLYVTLEPCNNYGKKPPCTLEIIKAGIKNVYYGMRDKNVSRGTEILKKNGVGVFGGLLKKEVEILTKDYLKYLKIKPKVSVKIAMTLDGKIATYEYDSKWITSNKSRDFVHRMRSKYDAVLIGKNTAIKDNPFLKTYSAKLKNPIRVVIDSKLEIPKTHHLIDGTIPTIIIYNSKITNIPIYLNKKWITLAPIDIDMAKKNFNLIINKLNSFSIKRILIEGGGNLIASALFSNVVNDIYFFIAPKIIGGDFAIPSVGGCGIKKISDSLLIKNMKVKKIDTDLLVTGIIKK
ncbi:MAG: bifunctional diaminohydroxyphosphoribosylaminopyrimidine deaminase/5-amino-6-(5-phosphoribosylamino)uracil reductase RibD [Endomicrobium sp.]|jgi:diaminohydroxyphosphoribosylaminopyrimidine deaminase/5-amino-6-(5-phosphoribosylamino)uracil reductase|nr:bifunctional diaminohydroxyphosphoribosylaminopyrimidine deaminase/5-amino-6-(5-phosphoribosylamino)uracil reductase RibD [Endomicrobium sp.]